MHDVVSGFVFLQRTGKYFMLTTYVIITHTFGLVHQRHDYINRNSFEGLVTQSQMKVYYRME